MRAPRDCDRTPPSVRIRKARPIGTRGTKWLDRVAKGVGPGRTARPHRAERRAPQFIRARRAATSPCSTGSVIRARTTRSARSRSPRALCAPRHDPERQRRELVRAAPVQVHAEQPALERGADRCARVDDERAAVVVVREPHAVAAADDVEQDLLGRAAAGHSRE